MTTTYISSQDDSPPLGNWLQAGSVSFVLLSLFKNPWGKPNDVSIHDIDIFRFGDLSVHEIVRAKRARRTKCQASASGSVVAMTFLAKMKSTKFEISNYQIFLFGSDKRNRSLGSFEIR